MALSPDTWYVLTVAPIATPVWTAGDEATSQVLAAAVNATTLLAFCLASDAFTTSIAYLGGTAVVPSGALTITGTPSMDTTVMDDGETWYSVRSGTEWQFYGSSSGIVRALANSTTLGAFIS